MNVVRGALLAASQSAWLRRRAMRSAMVRRAVSRFMPGETLDAALAAAGELGRHGLGTLLTHLGENIEDRSEAEVVCRHYLDVVERIRVAGLDTEVSVKLTQLGIDIGPDLACRLVKEIVRHAEAAGMRVWIDMEDSRYTEPTLALYRAVRATHPGVGVAIQSYLRRSAADLERLLPLAPTVRIVKGAYREPPEVAFPAKRDVDESFFRLASRLLEHAPGGARLVAGTHDRRLIARIEHAAEERAVPRDGFEFALLYGIQRDEQLRLARAGYRTRVLISYGASWFPWYMRRLAERPANLLFVLRNALGR